MPKVRLNIPEPERYPRMTQPEIDLVKKTILEGHKNILIAFRSDIRNFKTLYKDCYVVLTPFILYSYKKKEKKQELEIMTRIYLSDVKLIAFSKEQYLLVMSEDTSLVITALESLRLGQLLYRNYQIVFSDLTIEETCELKSYDMSLFPPVSLPLSHSQKFQFAYASLCAKQQIKYRNEVVRYLHSMVLTGNGVFDIAQLPTDILMNAKDLRPVLTAVDYMKFTSGFCCVDVKIPTLLRDLSAILSKSSRIKILYFNNCGITSGMKDISDALKSNRNLPIAYWSLDDNVITDFDYFPMIISAQSEPIRFLSLNRCGIKAEQTQALFEALNTNEKQHSIQVLRLEKCELSTDCVVEIDKYFENANETLTEINLGGIINGSQAVLSILRKRALPLKVLSLNGTSIQDGALEDLLQLIKESTTLKSLDISKSGITPKKCKKVIEAIADNESITRFDLSINGLGIHGEMLLHMLGAFLESDMEKWRSLSMDDNGMNAEDLRNILPLLTMMPRLRSLSLSRNFSEKTPNIASVLPGIAMIQSLTSLTIKGDESHKLGACMYPLIEKIASRAIVKIDFSGNNLGNKGCELAIQALRASPNVASFNISNNGLTSLQVWMSLSDAVVNAEELIDFSFNINDVLATISASKTMNQTSKAMNELQTAALQAVAARRRRKGLGCQFIEQEDNVQVSFKFDGGHTHSAVAKEFNLPLPFQTEGSHVEDGGKIREIDIGDMIVYQTDSMRYVIEEDISSVEPPDVTTQVVNIQFDSKGVPISTVPQPEIHLSTVSTVENTAPKENNSKQHIQFNYTDDKSQLANEFMNGGVPPTPPAIIKDDSSDSEEEEDTDIIKTKAIAFDFSSITPEKTTSKKKRRIVFDSDNDSDDIVPTKKKPNYDPRKKRRINFDEGDEVDDSPIRASPKKKRKLNIGNDDDDVISLKSTKRKKLEDSTLNEEKPKKRRATYNEESPKIKRKIAFSDSSDDDDEEPVKEKPKQKRKLTIQSFDSDSDDKKHRSSHANKTNKSETKTKPKRRLVIESDSD